MHIRLKDLEVFSPLFAKIIFPSLFRIETPAMNYNGEACLRFRYHMYGLDMGSLRVSAI